MNEEQFSTGVTAPGQERAAGQSQGGAQQKAKGVAQSAANEAGKLKDAAQEKGNVAIEQVKAGAESAAQQAKEVGTSYVAKQKETLANKVGEYAEAAHAAAERLQAEDGNMLAEPAGRAAEQLDRFAGYLREADPTDFLDDLEGLARRRPEVVFGGLFVAGLVAARFLKASRRKRRSDDSAEPRRSRPRALPPPGGLGASGYSALYAPGAEMGQKSSANQPAISSIP